MAAIFKIATMSTIPKYSRRNPEPAKRRPTTITVPARVGPHVKLVFTEMQRQNLRYQDVENASGVLRPALKAWRHKNKPNLDSIEAVMGALGFEFAPVPTARALPAEIVAALRPIAERLELTMPEAIRLAAQIAYRDHHMKSLQSPA